LQLKFISNINILLAVSEEVDRWTNVHMCGKVKQSETITEENMNCVLQQRISKLNVIRL